MAKPKRTRVIALGFVDESVAWAVHEELKAAINRKEIVIEDYVQIHKDADGKVTFTTDKSADPGAMRGAAFGGASGLVLAAISGPIGVGAVVGGAAIGAVTAALKDSGFKNDDLDAVSRLMARGRSGLLIAIPLNEADRFDAFEQGNEVIASADSRYQVDIVPGRSFEQAIDEYKMHEEG
jgi:uncharacterized membrane protein